MSEKQNITVNVMGESYPFAIEPEYEQLFREAVSSLNADVNECATLYGVSQTKALTVVLLNLQYRLLQAERRNSGEYAEVLTDLTALDAKLKEYLHSR